MLQAGAVGRGGLLGRHSTASLPPLCSPWSQFAERVQWFTVGKVLSPGHTVSQSVSRRQTRAGGCGREGSCATPALSSSASLVMKDTKLGSEPSQRHQWVFLIMASDYTCFLGGSQRNTRPRSCGAQTPVLEEVRLILSRFWGCLRGALSLALTSVGLWVRGPLLSLDC